MRDDRESARVWRLPSDLRLRWAYWDEEFVVYHAGSGETHLLDAFAAALLDQLASGPADMGELCRSLAEMSGASNGRALEAVIECVLEKLEEASLVESAAA